ncbi:hypothetical protein CHS0354_027417 [Potamilus streckersoni]|uniref:tRNA-dihydrouridine synthase n=1 Tax=Potamilus streckersoni TaxID=2493646 RepID=A0AAE0W0N4_9BIVA|nr:hypothetical protein CHS0354_027417 [Potamilus streckersoni]
MTPDGKAARALRLLCIAPMMKYTDRHFRYFIRLMSRRTFLFTEMIPSGAIANGQAARFLVHHSDETPVAAQFGGNHPQHLALCAKRAKEYGYTEVNLNAGCPSERVKNGAFGACLMKSPRVLKELMQAMAEASQLPVSIKMRVGVDEMDSYEFLSDLTSTVAESGCRIFYIHARKAWLNGLNPKQNRTVPVLQHEKVFRLKRDFPHLTIIINGGIQSFSEVPALVQHTDGVMIGRTAYENPLMFMEADSRLFGEADPVAGIPHLVERITAYMQADTAMYGTPVRHFAQHLLKFFHGFPGVAEYRRKLTQSVFSPIITDKKSFSLNPIHPFRIPKAMPPFPADKQEILRLMAELRSKLESHNKAYYQTQPL